MINCAAVAPHCLSRMEGSQGNATRQATSQVSVSYSQAFTSLSRTCLLELDVGNHLFDASSKLRSSPMCSGSDSHDQHRHTPHDANIARNALFDESVKKSCRTTRHSPQELDQGCKPGSSKQGQNQHTRKATRCLNDTDRKFTGSHGGERHM
jgi:hypothetical protein